MGRFRDKPAARLGALALGLGASLAASDAALRSAWLSPRQFRLDAELGLDRPPFAEVLVGREGGARLRFDRHGLNNDDAAWDRPGPRVAILGDSFVEAVEVPRAENAVARLGAALPGATVLNLGRAAATPPQAVALLRRLAARGERFDLVVLALSDNDPGDMAASAVGPGCAVAAHPPGLRRRVTAAVVQESPLLMRLQSRVREWGADLRWPSPGPAVAAAAPAPVPAAPEDLAVAAADGPLVARTAECVRALAGIGPLALLVMPGGDLPRAPERLERGRQRLALYRAVAEAAEVPWLIDAWSAFGADPLGDRRMVNGFANHVLGAGHLNPAGHALLVEILAREVPPLLEAARGGGRRHVAGVAAP